MISTKHMRHTKPVAFVLYHYFPPDDVVSAVHFGELCSGLVQHGWQVTAYPCVWGCRDDSVRFPLTDRWQDVSIRRLWRPRFRQASGLGRLLNAIWMIASWCLLALHRNSHPDVLLVGTDPVLSILVARFWKLFRPKTKIVHWCFDLYPEAAIADGLLTANGFLARVITSNLRAAYRACSIIVDLGPCMRRLLLEYPSDARRETLVPWALDEPTAPLPPDSPERDHIFGNTQLALFYSGSFGRAHSYSEILDLAGLLEPKNIKVAFSVRGNRESELLAAVHNRRMGIRFVPFATADKLAARMACADVHIVSLRQEWTGIVVPSKFFGALSAGRPILFSGSSDSSITHWIRTHQIGWVLNAGNISQVAVQLLEYAESPAQQKAMQERCFVVYQRNFSKVVQIERWNQILRSLLSGF